MTTDEQRWAAIGFAEKILEALAGKPGRHYPMEGLRVPKELRTMARRLLKHYPNDLWVERVQEELGSAEVANRLLVSIAERVKRYGQ